MQRRVCSGRANSLGLEHLNFSPQHLVLLHPTLQKATGQQDFFCHALRDEHIDATKLVLARTEVLHLDPAFVDECLEAVVRTAGADAQFSAISRWVMSGLSCSIRKTRKHVLS